MEKQYEELLDRQHPTSLNHPRMSIRDRAAQFSPFQALTGYGEAVEESARMTEEEMLLGEDRYDELQRSIQNIIRQLPANVKVRVTFFQPDEKKSGGAYCQISGSVKKVEENAQTLVLDSGKKIPLSVIIELNLEENV